MDQGSCCVDSQCMMNCSKLMKVSFEQFKQLLEQLLPAIFRAIQFCIIDSNPLTTVSRLIGPAHSAAKGIDLIKYHTFFAKI